MKLRNVKKPAQVQNTIIEKMVDLYEEAELMKIMRLTYSQMA